MTNPAFEDAFNLLCGDKLGSGIHRDVYACRLRPDCVVKVEIDTTWRIVSNYIEQKFWNDNEHRPNVARWLAPCMYLSPDARILIQRRVDPIRSTDKMPDMLPTFLSDIKRENFGILDDKIVCVDYAIHIDNVSTRLKKVSWT